MSGIYFFQNRRENKKFLKREGRRRSWLREG
jgi:hypothetical protein